LVLKINLNYNLYNNNYLNLNIIKILLIKSKAINKNYKFYNLPDLYYFIFHIDNFDNMSFYINNYINKNDNYLINGTIYKIPKNKLIVNTNINIENQVGINLDRVQQIKDSIITLKIERGKIKMDKLLINNTLLRIRGNSFKNKDLNIPLIYILNH
jgi:hypothetical protein